MLPQGIQPGSRQSAVAPSSSQSLVLLACPFHLSQDVNESLEPKSHSSIDYVLFIDKKSVKEYFVRKIVPLQNTISELHFQDIGGNKLRAVCCSGTEFNGGRYLPISTFLSFVARANDLVDLFLLETHCARR